MIRGDKIAWISGSEERVSNIKHLMNQVRERGIPANSMNELNFDSSTIT